MFKNLDNDIDKYCLCRSLFENIDRFGIIFIDLDKEKDKKDKEEERKT